MSWKKHVAGKVWTALTGGKQKTTGTEVIKGFTSKFKNQKSKEDIILAIKYNIKQINTESIEELLLIVIK